MSGQVSNRELLRIAPGDESFRFATDLATRSGFVSYNPQNQSAYQTQLDNWWNSYFQQGTNIDVLDREIADITTEIESGAGSGGTGGGGTPGDPGPGNGELDGGDGIGGSYSGTGGYVPPTMPQIDQTEARNRVRRDAPRIAFAQPRFGVGLNIPLGT